jgi:transcriptional/translational regulatory protein YebC/TACO1
MSYTTITVSRPGAKMRSGTTADEANANFAEVQAIVAANGGEMSLVGYDHARAANVAIVTYPDADAAATAAIQIDAAQLLDVESRGMFSTMEELWPTFTAALG